MGAREIQLTLRSCHDHATIDPLEKRRVPSSAEFLEKELRSRLLFERLNEKEKFRCLLSTVLLHMLLNVNIFTCKFITGNLDEFLCQTRCLMGPKNQLI